MESRSSYGKKIAYALVAFAALASFLVDGDSQSFIAADTSAVTAGPVTVSVSATSLQVNWKDGDGRSWQADFSLDASKPLITSIALDGRKVVDRATPVYRATLGKRKGGWDAFFDDPADDHNGATSFVQEFHPTHVTARSVGDRVEVSFDGMRLGGFTGQLRYTFYPGSSLVQQAAVVSTTQPDVAYVYNAGLSMTVEENRRAGMNMASRIVFYDPLGELQQLDAPYGSERHTVQLKYRAMATTTGAGSIAVFPAPHRYLFARDYSTNLGFAYYSSWRGRVGMGIQEPLDDNTKIYPWMNAPAGTEQELGVFLYLSGTDPAATLKNVLAYTHDDRFQHLPGYITFAPHWHFAYTVQEMEKGPQWEPPFETELKATGVDSALIFDFHLEGHPDASTDVRLKELEEMYKACRARSNSKFLLIPGEEADVFLGGHWGLVFPKPVYWYKNHAPGEPFAAPDSRFGTVYHVGTPAEMWEVIKREHGYVYETHPRTKGSTGFPDRILDTDYFHDSRYFGVGWKAMPSDLSSPRLGERAFKTLDDLNNKGLHKRLVGEDDLFEISPSDELYSQMNINYVKLPALPDFDHYETLIDAVAKGSGFISTGEILLPTGSLQGGNGDSIQVAAQVSSTFPLRLAEIVWGDGRETHHYLIDLTSTHPFEDHMYKWSVDAPGWTWARLAVWDIAADGAFTNPIWRDPR